MDEFLEKVAWMLRPKSRGISRVVWIGGSGLPQWREILYY